MKLMVKSKLLSLHKDTEILDEQENVVFKTRSKFLTLHDATEMVDASGTHVATITKKLFAIHYIYDIEMASGVNFEIKEELLHLFEAHIDIDALGWKLKGEDILNFDFDITDSAGNTVARSQRKLITLHDVYTIEVFDESKAAEVAAIVVVLQHINDIRRESTGEALDSASRSQRS